MSKPKGDPTSLGSILLEWEIVTKAQLDAALEQQKNLRGDDLLGKLLIANGACTQDEIDIAVSAQASMRANGGAKHKRAMACADLALERHRRDSIVAKRLDVIDKAERIQESIRDDPTPVVTSSMVVKRSTE